MNPEDGRRSPEREITQCCGAVVKRKKVKAKVKVEAETI
jgi:hypothetical protein